jgi:hypothetical protein
MHALRAKQRPRLRSEDSEPGRCSKGTLTPGLRSRFGSFLHLNVLNEDCNLTES